MKKALIAFGLGLVSLSAFPGEKGGNGGGGHFCKTGKTEVYDLQEGRVRYRMNVLDLNGTEQESIDLGLRRVKAKFPVFAYLIEKEIAKVRGMMEKLNTKIERTLDADNLYVNEECEYLQIANWDTSVGRLIISQSRWNQLPDAQKGVLIFHEAVYSLYRSKLYGLQLSNGDTSVDPVRKFVAEVFSTEEIKTKLLIDQFLVGGLIPLMAKNKGRSDFIPKSPLLDYAMVENPYCQSTDYKVSFTNADVYHLNPGFGPQPGEMLKVKAGSVLDYDVTMPISYVLSDYTNIERAAMGRDLDNRYDPTTVAGVRLSVTRVGCGETGSFRATCGIARPNGMFKRVICTESYVQRFPL